MAQRFLSRAKNALDMIFRPNKALFSYFKMLDGYVPIFSTYDGGVYEMELTRSCIHAFAAHSSKLMPSLSGADSKGIKKILEGKVNVFMTPSQFLYKVATIYEATNTCWIVPIYDSFGNIAGFYPVNPELVEVVQTDNGTLWIRFSFGDGSKGAVELEHCGVISKYLYKNDLQGENNSALNPTMRLLDIQNKGIAEGIKNSASFRFIATANNFAKSSDLEKERQSFSEKNLAEGKGGLLLFPNTYSNIQQVNSHAQTVDPEQMSIIQTRVFNYFGTNEDILQNKSVGDSWDAYYEGKIEPFAVQLSEAMTCMIYTKDERARGNAIVWSANRLQYMSNRDKLQTSSQMFDRGVFSLNMIMDIWNLPHVDGGDKRYIRKEYTEISQLDQVAQLQKELDTAQNALNAATQPPAPNDPPEGDNNPNNDDDETNEGGQEDGNTEG